MVSTEVLIDWFWGSGGIILGVIIGAFVAEFLLNKFIERIIRRLVPQGSGSKEAEEKRENTLIQVVGGTARVLLWVVVLLMVLSELGVAIGPLLAAAGVAGIAIGFGGQYLIRDLFSGFFILIENQYRIGDVVCFDQTCGVVEEISLRMTRLRDLDGVVHHIPHGEVKTVSNLSKQFSRVNLNIGVAYDANLEKVIEVVNKVGKELSEDEAWKQDIIQPPAFLRVDEFADSAVVIKIVGDTQPGKQWGVAGELRKRLKIAFDREKIEIPFPQRVIYQKK